MGTHENKNNKFKEIVSRRRTKRIILIVVFVLLVYFSLFTGGYNGLGIINVIADNGDARLAFTSTYLPRTIAIVFAASGLSVAGLIMQSISRNKFMAPSTSGANDAAMLGMLIGLIFLPFENLIAITIFAFLFSFLAIMVFTTVVNSLKIKDAAYIPLLGMLFGAFLSALTASIAHRFELLQMVTGLGIGNFNRLGGFGVIYLIAIPLILILIFSHKFSIIGMGEDFAKNLGVNYHKVVFLGLFCVALVSATAFVSVGALPFIGLIIPNLVSSIYGDNIKKSLVDLMIFGASFLLLADVVSRVILPAGEIPVGLTISILGGVIFLIYVIGGSKNAKPKKS